MCPFISYGTSAEIAHGIDFRHDPSVDWLRWMHRISILCGRMSKDHDRKQSDELFLEKGPNSITTSRGGADLIQL
jgi:hypothetical protein